MATAPRIASRPRRTARIVKVVMQYPIFPQLWKESGEELGVVSRILGHSQIATTADVYAHLTPSMLERSAARMDAILAPRPEAASG